MASRLWDMLGAAQRKRYSGHFGGEVAARRAYESGANLSAARGHHRANLSTSNVPRPIKATSQERADRAIEMMQRDGIGLSQAAKRAGVAPETVRRYGREHNYISKTYDEEKRTKRGQPLFRGWSTKVAHEPVLTSDGVFIPHVEFSGAQGTRVSHYWHTVNEYINEGASIRLLALGTVRVTALDGTIYTLETDPTAISRWWQSLTDAERRNFSNLFVSEDRIVRAA